MSVKIDYLDQLRSDLEEMKDEIIRMKVDANSDRNKFGIAIDVLEKKVDRINSKLKGTDHARDFK